MFFLAGMAWWFWSERWKASGAIVLAVLALTTLAVRAGWYQYVMPFALPVLLFSLASSFGIPRWLNERDYSYGIYVFGFLVQRVLWQLGAPKLGPMGYGMLSLIATVPIAALSWHAVEKPAMRLKEQTAHWLQRISGLFRVPKAE